MPIASLDVDADGVALITLDDPQRAVNVTSPALVGELIAALDHVATDPAIRGAVLTSGKSGSFVAGGDIKDFATAHDRGMSEEEAFRISDRWNVDLRRIERCGKPVAAAINGAALGGGLELALCCHHRVLVDDPKAIVGLVEVGIGLLPAGGGSQRLPRLLGIDAALRLMIDARRLKPAEALSLGIVDSVVPAAEAVDRARGWVREHAGAHACQPWERPGYRLREDEGERAALRRRWEQEIADRFQGNYPAPVALLQAVFDGAPRPIDDGLRIESRCAATLMPGAVACNLMRTTFIQKGLADRKARGAAPAAAVLAVRTLDGATLLCGGHDQPAAANEVLLVLWPPLAGVVLGEVLSGPQAPSDAVAAALACAAQRRATPVVAAPGKASFVLRLLARYRDEGRVLRDEGVSQPTIERAARRAGMAYCVSRAFVAPADCPADGALPDVATVESIRMRLLCGVALEAVRCYDEGLLPDAGDADLASVYGAGFPPWSGGVLSFIDTLGAREFASRCDLLHRSQGPRFEVPAMLRAMASTGGRFHPRGVI
jgi:enoyl-CoA hydratase/carnithine racemase